MAHRLSAPVALVHASYYLITGLWPLVSIGTFQKVTGPKTDRWLVKTVGILVGVVGLVIGLAGLRRRAGPEIQLLAVGCALGLAGIDVVYATRRRIARVYLLDALAEVLLAGAWAYTGRHTPGGGSNQ